MFEHVPIPKALIPPRDKRRNNERKDFLRSCSGVNYCAVYVFGNLAVCIMRIIERIEAKTEKELSRKMADYRERYPYVYGVECIRRGVVHLPGDKKPKQVFADMARYGSAR